MSMREQSSTPTYQNRRVGFEGTALKKETTYSKPPSPVVSPHLLEQAPDPTYESAQRLARLSTMEVMSLLRSRSRADLRGAASVSDIGDVEIPQPEGSTVQIQVPPQAKWTTRLREKWDSVTNSVATWARGWYQRNVPKTLDHNRLGIQWVVCLTLTSSVLWSDRLMQLFGFPVVFMMVGSVTVFDPTWGGHIIKAADRFMGIVGGVLLSQLLFIPLYYSGFKSMSKGTKAILYFYGISMAWVWCYIRSLKPAHITLPTVGIATIASVFSMVTGNYVYSTWIIGLCSVMGIAVGTLVFGFVLPKSARSLLRKDLQTVCDKIAEALEPLVEFEAGVVHSQSFFQKPVAPTAGEGLIKTLSKGFSRSRSSMTRGNNTPETICSGVDREVETLDVDIFERFRISVWKQIESVYTLLDAQQTIVGPASKELSHKPPHRFPMQEYQAFYAAIKRLFYHVVSLYLVLDTQSSVIKDGSMLELLGDRVMYAGVGIKIDAHKKTSTTDEAAKVLPLHHRWSIPGGGLARTLERPATEFEVSRQRGKSIPNFARLEPEPDAIDDEAKGVGHGKASSSTPKTSQPFSSPPSPPERQRSVSNLSHYVGPESEVNFASPKTSVSVEKIDWLRTTSTVLWNETYSEEESNMPKPTRTSTLAPPSQGFPHRAGTSHASLEPPVQSGDITTGPTRTETQMSRLTVPSPSRKIAEIQEERGQETHFGPPMVGAILSPRPSLLDASKRQLSMVSVLSEISNQSARTGTAIDDIINASPVVRWVEMYGPLIGRVSRHVATAVMQFSTCMERHEMCGALDDHIRLAEEALSELTSRRVLWYRTVQIMFNAQLLNELETGTPEDIRASIDEYLFRRWMGLTPAAYSSLSVQARTNFWEAFGNIQDRLSTTARVLMGLLVELKTCRATLAVLVATAHPAKTLLSSARNVQ